jgi:uncharacterized protein (UPF0305 family)
VDNPNNKLQELLNDPKLKKKMSSMNLDDILRKNQTLTNQADFSSIRDNQDNLIAEIESNNQRKDLNERITRVATIVAAVFGVISACLVSYQIYLTFNPPQ